MPVLLATGLGAATGFYHDLLGLEIVGESDRHIVFRCGGGTQLAVTKSTAGTAGTWTQATWLVQDLRAEVDWLRSRGVNVEEYDLPGLTGRHRRHRVRLGGMGHRPGREHDGRRADEAVRQPPRRSRPTASVTVCCR